MADRRADGRSLTTPSFARAYDEHLDAVFRFLAHRVGSRETAEDLAQVTFEKALRAWPRYDARKASVLTWLVAIARNVLIDHARTDRGELLPLHDTSAERLTIEDAPQLGPSGELARALTKLNDREREILGLRFGAELNGPEIAEITGLTLANVQQILSRTLRRLQCELADG